MCTKGKSHNLKKLAVCLLTSISMIVCAIPQSVKAENVNYSEAATAVKNYILQNGTNRNYGTTILREDNESYVYITNENRKNALKFAVLWPKIHNLMATFDYDLSTNQVINNHGWIVMEGAFSETVMAEALFLTEYRDGEPLYANIQEGQVSDVVTMSKLMTTSFSIAMKEWNSMIEDITGGKYNIGNLGFTNYVTPISSQNMIKKTEKANSTRTDANIRTKRISMYRLYNPNSGEHFYTASSSERESLVKAGWRYEGIGWTAPRTSRTPVYRLYNPNAGDHHYTTKKSERDALVKAGWKYENIGWYSDDNHGKPLYRQYNPNAKKGTHNYTTSKSENDKLVRLGWRDEGIGWYGVA